MAHISKDKNRRSAANATEVIDRTAQAGGLYITTTATFLGDFNAIFAHTAVVIAVLVSSNIGGTLTAVTIPAGEVYYGRFSSIQLTSGQVTAYYAR